VETKIRDVSGDDRVGEANNADPLCLFIICAPVHIKNIPLRAEAVASNFGKCVRTARPQVNTAEGPWRGRCARFLPASPLMRRTKPATGQRLPLGAPSSESGIQQNDLVAFAGHPGTWKVIAPVNGGKADICKNEGFDTHIITAPLASITIVRRAGSPDYNY
jgi:hypothetical protein